MKKAVYFMLAAFLLLLVSACSGQVTPEQTAGVELEIDSPTATPLPQATEVAAAEPTVEAVDYCLDCHSDQEMLIATAKEEEEVINENSGEG